MKDHWFRFYDGVPHDPKILRLSDRLFRIWVNLLCLASAGGGVLPSIDDMALVLRTKASRLASDLAELIQAGLFEKTEGGVMPHNWNGRQFKSDVSTDRVKRFREKERNVPRNGDETLLKRPQIAETETDTEQSRAEQGLAKLEELLRKAAGWENEPAPKLSVTGPIQALIDAGADLKADILPIVKALAPNVQTRTSWAYFVKPIREAHQARIAAGRPVNGNGKSSQVDWTTFTHRDYANAVDIAKSRDEWFPAYGPPDRIPPDLMDDDLRRIVGRAKH